MIDYKKLQIAHELAKETHQILRTNLVTFEDGHMGVYFNCSADKSCQEDLDGIIVRLTELTQPKPKYKVGDKVWVYGWDEEITEDKIEKMVLNKNTWIYNDWIEEGYHRLYPTKQALIESQIEYWTKLKLESMEPPFEGEIHSFRDKYL
jgi:hypothetical protein